MKTKTESNRFGIGLEKVNLAMSTGGPSRFDLAMKWASRVVGPAGLGYALYGLSEDCKEFHETGLTKDGNKCVPSAVWTGFAAFVCVVGYCEWAIEIGDSLQRYALRRTGDMLGRAWDRFNAFGPFTAPPEGAIPMPPVRARGLNDDILKRADESMSQKMGLDVRHIGLWDGLMPGEEAKRDEREKHYPVFAFRRNEVDFHAAYIGEHGPGQGSRLKIGMGPGPQTEINTQRLKARQFSEDDGNYNAQYFDRGGLDFFGEVSTYMEEEAYLLSEDPDADLQWLHDEIYCTMNADGPGSDYPGFWFVVLDHEYRKSYVTGAVAAFYPGFPSIIDFMKHEGRLEVKEDCTVDDPYLDD